MHHRRIWPLALLAAGLCGCAPVPTSVRGTYICFGGATVPSSTVQTAAPEVGVFFTEVPERTFFEVGIVEAMGFGSDVKQQELVPELQRQAAAMGADAVYRIDVQRFDQSGAALYASAVAVRYR